MVGVHQECPIRLYITFRKRSQWAMKVIVVYIYLLSTSHLMGQWHEQLLGELCWVAVWWLRRRSVDTAGHSIFRESEFSFFMAPRIVLERKTEDDGWRNRDVKDVIGMKWPQSLVRPDGDSVKEKLLPRNWRHVIQKLGFEWHDWRVDKILFHWD